MGQKVNPISNRLGIIRGWDSNWFGGKNYGDKLVEDYKIRKYLNARLAKAVKEFMIATLSRYSYGIEFSDDYKKIRKSDIAGLPDLLKKK